MTFDRKFHIFWHYNIVFYILKCTRLSVCFIYFGFNTKLLFVTYVEKVNNYHSQNFRKLLNNNKLIPFR